MKGYKAFSKGMSCRGKQYAENTTFEEENAEICRTGMHFCENPIDVLDHYPLVDDNGDFSEFAEVEADEAITNDKKKYCTKKLKIGAKLSFKNFIHACTEYIKEETEVSPSEDAIGDYAQIGSSGYYARIGSSGDSAQIGSSGYYARIGSSGDSARIRSEGKNSVICCAGNKCAASAKIGSWITLAEWKYINNAYTPVRVKTEYVDGERIKEDVLYRLVNGEFVEDGIE